MPLAYVFVTSLGVNGSLWIILAPIVISPLAMLGIRLLLEPNGPSGLLDPRTQSWAFFYGDTIALPFAFAMLALGWRKLDDGWYDGTGWFLACLIIGFLVACGYHFVLEGHGYESQGFAALLGSPTKIWHDFVVYGSLSGALIYLGIPILIYEFKIYGALALIGLGIWGLLGVADNTVHPLDPAKLHPPVSETKLA